jgi:hypothetical protein
MGAGGEVNGGFVRLKRMRNGKYGYVQKSKTRHISVTGLKLDKSLSKLI